MNSSANDRQHTLSTLIDRSRVDFGPTRDLSLSSPDSQGLPTLLPPPSASLSPDPSIPTWKRRLDLLLICLTIPIWLGGMALVSVWIRIVSPGPLLYRQERIGYWGRRFMILKFRTMHVNSETVSHEGYFETLMQSNCPMTKLDARGDARLIRGGRILRALALDELPQLLNVIRGEMTLVGPRPCTPHEFERYLPEQKVRVHAPPGLTGYWQVNGKNKTSFSQMISMDIHYGQRMSVLMDLGIILKTLPAIGIQVCESIGRKTSSKVQRFLRRHDAGSDAPPNRASNELQKDTRRYT
jgi:exopolysaccharide production protein ExoY